MGHTFQLQLQTYGKKQKHMTHFGIKVKGPPPDIKGKTPFTLFSGFTLVTPVFTHNTPARRRYSPNDCWMCRTGELNWKSNQDGHVKRQVLFQNITPIQQSSTKSNIPWPTLGPFRDINSIYLLTGHQNGNEPTHKKE